jgi:hypothetical protein
MWFTINLVFEGVPVSQTEQESIWEERLLLIWADDEDQAQQQGEARARAEEHEYVAVDGKRTQWQFRQVERVFPLVGATLETGTELFSRFFRAGEVRNWLTPSQD